MQYPNNRFIGLAQTPVMPGAAGRPSVADIEQQRLRILRCTALSLASTLGGLRFKPGSRTWLPDLSASGPHIA